MVDPVKKQSVVISPFMDLMGGYTSDHTWQSVNVQVPAHSLSLNVATWNLQNKCSSKATNQERNIPYSNNPADVDETVDQYTYRKDIQVEQIKALQATNSAILLQEADVFINPKWASHYKDQVEQDDWKLLISPKKNLDVHQNKVAILYDSKALNLIDGDGPIMEYNGTYYGYEWKFIELASSASIALASLHLDYTHDFSEQILIHQDDLIAQRVTGILGGDTNHTPRLLDGFIGNPSYATNVHSVNGNLSVFDNHPGNIPNDYKKYDGFFVNPPFDDSAIVTENGGQYIEIVENCMVVKELPTYLPDFHPEHHIVIGEGWGLE